MSDRPLSSSDGAGVPGHCTEVYQSGGEEPTLVRILDAYLAELQAGRTPDRHRLLAEHPSLGPELEQCLAGMEFVHRATRQASEVPVRLGDFRILRELGRGGMGVVYEAEQVSLRRRVALKVLRLGTAADAEGRQRFRREAETVARLHHTNIVPVYAVGEEQGVHYYAMQFIEGRSLAAVLEESQRAPEARPLDGTTIARWGLQAAEALAHAHQRGVIHRDVKPSNLLLDAEEVVWLSDFGLAKRSDEVTLTLSGVLLGTPRYMSPEQASGVQQPVDHRTDVYSLGATLYELATGHPVFRADTPQGVLTQILSTEPMAPRLLHPALPRDLETIILKCLAKEPPQRYATAQDLADDLRAFLDGRSIQARRPSWLEQGLRWARKNRRTASTALAAAVFSATFALAALASLGAYREAQLGRFTLESDEEVPYAEVFHERSDTLAAPRFTVPTLEPLALPGGSYRVRVEAPGRLSDLHQLFLEQGGRMSFTANRSERWLWPPVPVPRCFEVVEQGNRVVLLVLTETGLLRLDSTTATPVWSVEISPRSQPLLAGHPDFRWDWLNTRTSSGRGAFDLRPMLVRPVSDLDGDGHPDLVWACRHQPTVLAVSSHDGKLLWVRHSRLKESGDEAGILSTPAALDVDEDGVLDVLATFLRVQPGKGSAPDMRCWVEVLSGRTGQPLRQLDLGRDWLARDADAWNHTPRANRWYLPGGTGVAGGFTSGVHINTTRAGQSYVSTSESTTGKPVGAAQLYDHGWAERTLGRWVPAPAAAAVARVRGRTLAVLQAGTQLLGWDLASGASAWPAFPAPRPAVRPPLLADLNGDGDEDVLLLTQGPNTTLELTALALPECRELWRVTLTAEWGHSWFEELPDWPLLRDLDGDGKLEIMVPTGGFQGTTKWAGVEVRDGVSGTPRWQQALVSVPVTRPLLQVQRFTVGPDLDRDGCREVLAALVGPDPTGRDDECALYVTALRGSNGQPVWSWRQPQPEARLTSFPGPTVGPLQWCQAGADGHPQLVVPYRPNNRGAPFYRMFWRRSLLSASGGTDMVRHRQPCRTYVLHSGSGTPGPSGLDLDEPRVVDLDGDGLLDLLAYRANNLNHYDGGGKLFAVRGTPPETWRRLGGSWYPVQDLDGDGIADLTDRGSRRHTAVSGRDGRVLWRAQDDHGGTGCLSPPLPQGDLDGDGAPDLLFYSTTTFRSSSPTPVLQAVSGRTGRVLWTGDVQAHLHTGTCSVECHDLAGDGRPEVVLTSSLGWGDPPATTGISSTRGRFWLGVLSGQDGRTLWKQCLSDWIDFRLSVVDLGPRPAVADLDGDGTRDVVVAAIPTPTTCELRAFSGRDGTLLWRRSLAERSDCKHLLRTLPVPVGGDLDGDGHPEILVLDYRLGPGQMADRSTDLVVLDGRNGQTRWTWRGVYDAEGAMPDQVAFGLATRPRPLPVNLQGDGRRAVCLWNWTARAAYLFDGAGRLVDELKLPPQPTAAFHILAHDLDGSGVEALLVADKGSLRASRGGWRELLWEWQAEDGYDPAITFAPHRQREPATLVVRAAQSLIGLDGASGRLQWRHQGPGDVAGVLFASNDPVPPRVVVHLPDPATVCRLALPTDAAGRYQALSPLSGTLPAPPEAPRFLRPLPWSLLAPLPDPPLLYLACSAAALAAILVVAPVLLLRRAWRRRSWRTGLLAILWWVLVVGFLVANSPSSFLAQHLGHCALLALGGLPLLAFLADLVRSAWRGTWRRLVELLGLSLVLALMLGWGWARYDAAPGPLLPQYDWTSWYWVWLLGMQGSGVVLLLAPVGRLAAGAVRRGLQEFAAARTA